jgi:hypothetical protein
MQELPNTGTFLNANSGRKFVLAHFSFKWQNIRGSTGFTALVKLP